MVGEAATPTPGRITEIVDTAGDDFDVESVDLREHSFGFF